MNKDKERVIRAQRVNNSVNFKNGSFANLSPTKMKPDDVSYVTMIRKSMNRPNASRPDHSLPVVKTDLKNLSSATPVVVWFGHSSYLIHYKGKNVLVDPCFSGYASPFSFMVKAFDGANSYSADDMPAIDLLIITHDHYDHLDVHTVRELAPKIKSVCTSLGVGDRLADLLPGASIAELDWWESASFDNIHITACPARHFSGRGLKRNGSLWSSFVVKLESYSVFAGGDSGYDYFFKEIGDRFGPFDIALLECGQYNDMWPMIHMMPEQTAQAARDLRAKWLMPVHWSKFALSLHTWNEPVQRVKLAAEKLGQQITTPRIGEQVIIGQQYPQQNWWS